MEFIYPLGTGIMLNMGNPPISTYYRNQLKELIANYGPVFEIWFDGANGGTGFYGGTNENRKINGATYYDWPGTISLVRNMQPNVIFFSDAGPSIRWVGNERGSAGKTNWNTISIDTLYAGKAGIEDLLNTGSRWNKLGAGRNGCFYQAGLVLP